MFHPEEMFEPLTESVRAQLMTETRSWVMAEFSDEELCGGLAGPQCASVIRSVIQAANEGISRGVALTGVWFDKRGLGPRKKKMSAYGWGCVFDEHVLEHARRQLVKARSSTTPG